MMRTSLTTLLIALTLGANAAHADVWVQSGISWVQIFEEDEAAGSASVGTNSRMLTSHTAGYTFAEGFIVGAQLQTDANSANGRSAWSLGPKGGLMLGGFELTGTYYPLARETRETSSATTRYSGGGFSVNIGYNWNVGGPLHLGLMGTYWSMEFSERDDVDLSAPVRVSYFTPMVTLGFEF